MENVPNKSKAEYDRIIAEAEPLIDGKKFTEAKAILIDMPEEFQEQGLYQAYLGHCHFYLDEFEKAISCFDRVIDDRKTAENILFMRALSKDRLNKIPEAIEDYKQVLEINPKALLVHRNLGLLAESEGKFAKARKFYREALKLDESDEASQTRLDEISDW